MADPRGRRWWRWEQCALLALLLLASALAGWRPTAAGDITQAIGVARTIGQADRLAASQPLQAAARWASLAPLRPGDLSFQALVWANVIDLRAAAGDAPGLEQALASAVNQPAYLDGQPRLMLSVGVRHLAAGHADAAVIPLSRGLLRGAALDSTGIRLRVVLALAHERTGATDAAEQLLCGLVDACPDEHWLAAELARHYADRGTHLAQARALAARALRQLRAQQWWQLGRREHREDLATYTDVLGWVLYRSGQRDEAQGLLEKALNMAAGSARQRPLNLYHLGELYFDRGQDSDALRCAERAVALDPTLTAAKLLRDRIVNAAQHGREPT